MRFAFFSTFRSPPPPLAHTASFPPCSGLRILSCPVPQRLLFWTFMSFYTNLPVLHLLPRLCHMLSNVYNFICFSLLSKIPVVSHGISDIMADLHETYLGPRRAPRQWAPTLLASGTGFMEDNFSTDGGGGGGGWLRWQCERWGAVHEALLAVQSKVGGLGTPARRHP